MGIKRTIVCVLDSFGIGASPDAAKYGDENANTFGHIAEKTENLALDNMGRLGLYQAFRQVNGAYPKNVHIIPENEIIGAYAVASETSFGKDTPSGHWEMMGVPVLKDWLYMPSEYPSFPLDFLDELAARTGMDGWLGNCAASGTEILKELGEEHINLLKQGKKMPIVYTSADSVLQIAVCEELFGLDALYRLCATARKFLDEKGMYIGRVIARPFSPSPSADGSFVRNAGRHDYSVPPPSHTLLRQLTGAGYKVTGIGKIPDIYAHIGISREVAAPHNEQIFNALLQEMDENSKYSSVIMANFVDFDMMFGHRRDIAGYAQALQYFDARLPEIMEKMTDDDLLIITSDHGCDPSYKGTEHTREYVPILAFSKGIKPQFLGKYKTFAKVAYLMAEHLDFLPDICPLTKD